MSCSDSVAWNYSVVGIVRVPNERLGKLVEMIVEEIASSPVVVRNDVSVPIVPANDLIR